MSKRTSLASLCLLTLLVSWAAIPAQEAKYSAMASTLTATTRLTFRPVIEFGHDGGNLRPYRIGIDANGQVRVLKGRPHLKTDHIPAEKVRELISLASDKSFWESSAADDAQTPQVLPDFGFVFVRVRSAGGHPAIYHRGQHTGALGRFYTQLSDLVLA